MHVHTYLLRRCILMKAKKLLIVLAILAILLSGFSSPASVKADWSKVDQRVLDQIEIDGTAGFVVIMTEQADLSGAEALEKKVEKTTYVYNQLTSIAARTQAPLLAQLKADGVTFKSFYIMNIIEVTAGRTTVEWLASRSEVARIVPLPNPQKEPVSKDLVGKMFGPDLPTAANTTLEQGVETIEWNITRVGAPDVWAMGIHGEGMVVADNDTGVDHDHPALVDKYRGNLGGGSFNHNYNWWDAWGGAPSPVPVDYDGHGTHTMGTMVGDDGGSNQIGMAPGAQWIACAGLNYECLQFFLTPWDLNGQNPDPSKAPDAINNSWYDTSGFDYRPIVQALNAAGIAVIKSAGNWGQQGCSTISPPGNVPEIIATAAFGQGDVIANFSSRGPDSTYGSTILKPEVAAPGVNVRSSVPGGGYEGGWSGTSMAAPHSTALVALIWSAAPCIQGDVPLTKQIMMDTAEAKIDAQCVPFVDHPNDVWGWGILDAQAAVTTAIGYCGGMGTLQGTVTDATTTLPLEGVTVQADGVGGFSRTDATDAVGFYTMDLLEDTYTVTASTYGYAVAEVTGVSVVADETTTQDFALTPLPVYTVSGYVKETGTNVPLANARVEFLDAPIPPVFTDATGFYTTSVAQGTWTLKASADLHTSHEQTVVVDGNETVDFLLDPLPCLLLVDDDQDGPDVRDAYTGALDTLGYSYNIWDVGDQGDPAEADLLGYAHVVWFNGYPFSGTFNGANETAVAAYLDAGGNFFFSSQDYLYDAGLTAFGQNYLKIASFTSDVSQTTVTGQNVYAGLGPYTLSYPFTNYSDTVNPNAQGQVAFTGNVGNAAVSFDGADFNTAFLGYPFEALPQAGRVAVMERTVEDLFGGCELPQAVSITPPVSNLTGDPGAQVSHEFTVTNLGPDPQDVLLSVANNTWLTEGPASTGELVAGASATVTVVVTIPADLAEISDSFNLTATGVVGGASAAVGNTSANVNPAVNVVAPADGSGLPFKLVAYEFTVTNSGDYTDTFSLEVSGVWPASLPGGDTTGALAAGASVGVTVLVEVPEAVSPGATDVTTLMVTSGLDPAVFAEVQVTTTASFFSILPIMLK
jgi:hypothetical protein